VLRSLIRMIPFLRQYERLRAEYITVSEHASRLLEHNRLLTVAATESAVKLQENTRLLTNAATESARRLQEREAELTQALAVMSQRVARLTEHNRWLAESAADVTKTFHGSEAEATAQTNLPEELLMQPATEIDGSMQVPVREQEVFVGTNGVELGVRLPPHQSCSRSNSLRSRSPIGCSGEREREYLPRRNHILMVTSVVTRGGCERQILATAEGLIRRGYQVEIFCLASPDAEANFIEEFSRLGIKCCDAFETADSIVQVDDDQDVQSVGNFAQLVDHLDVLAIGRALAQGIKEFRPEIIHCWSDFANVIGGLISTDLGVPKVVLSQRNMPAFRYVDGAEPYACRDAYRLLAHHPNVTMVNNSLAGAVSYATWLDIPTDKIKVVYNGFLSNGIYIRQRSETKACRLHLGISSDMHVVGAVMRFAAEKDPILWLETAAAIAVARPNVCFVLAGYGELAEQLALTIESLGLAQRFILSGEKKDVGLIYGALDVFLLTSRFEGSPNVLIEAQAAGIPVVAPDVGGTSETVLDGKTGVVVGNRRPLNLANAVLQILDDPSWRDRAAIHGPIFVSKRFGHQRMIDETIAVYHSKQPSEAHGDARLVAAFARDQIHESSKDIASID
jgi:glycosyltransferase involved in cell wall biosynthesis